MWTVQAPLFHRKECRPSADSIFERTAVRKTETQSCVYSACRNEAGFLDLQANKIDGLALHMWWGEEWLSVGQFIFYYLIQHLNYII
jgi:hypothetical protein